MSESGIHDEKLLLIYDIHVSDICGHVKRVGSTYACIGYTLDPQELLICDLLT